MINAIKKSRTFRIFQVAVVRAYKNKVRQDVDHYLSLWESY